MRQSFNGRVVVVGVQWRGSPRTLRWNRTYYGVTPEIPLLYNGPVGAFVRTSPTPVVFNRFGESVAWRPGPLAEWDGTAIHALLEALLR